MIRSKLVLPVLAIVFAVVSAFATIKPSVSVQQAWYDSNGLTAGGGMFANITTPSGDSPVCSVDASQNICRIVVDGVPYNAYDTQPNAETNGGTGSAGLLKYNP